VDGASHKGENTLTIAKITRKAYYENDPILLANLACPGLAAF
jgi:hypothetical protein